MVTFDLDGTLTTGHGWEYLANGLDRVDAYRETNLLFRKGKESEDVHLVRLLNIARGTPLRRIHALLERTPKIHGISATVRTLRRRGVRTALLTHNPGYICEWYCQRFGFDDAEGTVQRVRNGTVLGIRRIHADKRAGLSKLLHRSGLRGEEVAHLGDGMADAAVAPYVGTFIALNTTLKEVRDAADFSTQTHELTTLLPRLRTAVRPKVRRL